MINDVKAFEVIIGPERIGWIIEVQDEWPKSVVSKPRWAAIATIPKADKIDNLLGIFATTNKAHDALLKHEGIEKVNVIE